MTDDAAHTMEGDVFAAAHVGGDVRIVDAATDGVATLEYGVLDTGGQRYARNAANAAEGVIVIGFGGLDMALDDTVFDGCPVHQGADGTRHDGGGIRREVFEDQVAHFAAQHSEQTTEIGILVAIGSGVVEAEVVDGMAVAEETTRKAAAAHHRADGLPRSLVPHVEVGGQLESDPFRVAGQFVVLVEE